MMVGIRVVAHRDYRLPGQSALTLTHIDDSSLLFILKIEADDLEDLRVELIDQFRRGEIASMRVIML